MPTAGMRAALRGSSIATRRMADKKRIHVTNLHCRDQSARVTHCRPANTGQDRPVGQYDEADRHQAHRPVRGLFPVLLHWDDPAAFSGDIFDFTANGTLWRSDQIDLIGINYNSVHDSCSGGVLSVSDGRGDRSSTLEQLRTRAVRSEALSFSPCLAGHFP
jgi:hypothetical protein